MVKRTTLFCVLISSWSAWAGDSKSGDAYFGIQIVDSRSGRGVPMVELRTVSKSTYITDSAGWVAFNEPGLMDRQVYFEIKSHGYHYPKDRFGNAGTALEATRGETTTVQIIRDNLAERLYRVTGQGGYRDSRLLNRDIPLAKPLLNGDVVGQDTVQSLVYGGKIYWFWGDTNRPSYPLGQFKTSGATSELPNRGGLSPYKGIDLTYFVDANGFSREMTPVSGPGAVWLHGLFELRATEGAGLYGHYSRVKSLGEQYEHGLLRFNETTETFEKWIRFDDDAILHPRGQALFYENGIGDQIYFCRPFPSVRVEADVSAIQNSERYEAFTCLKAGTRFDDQGQTVERDESGSVVWGWKRGTETLGARQMRLLVENGSVPRDEARLCLESSDRLVFVDSGSVHWNDYRARWIMIAGELGGEESFLGDIWYAEAKELDGPWENARRIVTHDDYSFYNPAHHPFFDQDGGRVIFFEGTFSNTFSGTKTPTPRYDYNQIMYSLTLDDPRLELPPKVGRDSRRAGPPQTTNDRKIEPSIAPITVPRDRRVDPHSA